MSKMLIEINEILDDMKGVKPFDKLEYDFKFKKSDIPSPTIDRIFKPVKETISALLKNKNIHVFILKSPAGLGKTYNVIKHLEDNGFKIGTDYMLFSGHITPMELYKTIYRHNGLIIIIDDIEDLLSSMVSRDILKTATYSPFNKRITSWRSSRLRGYPSEFEVISKFILMLNNIPNKEKNKPIVSRAYFYELDISNKDKIKFMYEIAEIKKIPIEIVDYIKRKANSNLDFRILEKVAVYYSLGFDWKKQVDIILKQKLD